MMNPDKSISQHLERDQAAGYDENLAINGLSPEHREYLLRLHGTLDLDPIPAMDDADPYNWPMWKVSTCTIGCVAHATFKS